MEVASTTLRFPAGAGAMALVLLARTERADTAGRGSRPAARRAAPTGAPRPAGSPRAGQEHEHAAALFGERPRHRALHLRLERRRADRGRGSGSPPERRGPGSRSPAHRPAGARPRAPSRVADITSRRRSSRSTPCASRAKARPRSASRLRSWNSSNSTPATPSSPGSSRIMRVNTPSVTTSIRVSAETRECEPHAVADRSPDRLAQGRRHALGGRPGRQSPRLQHDQLAAAHPGLVHQSEGNDSGLPGPGRRDQHGGRPRPKRGQQGWEGLGDGKVGLHDGQEPSASGDAWAPHPRLEDIRSRVN